MSNVDMFREYLLERLTTAGLEIFEAMKKTFAEYEEQIQCSKEEIARLRQLVDIVTQPQVKLHITDVQQFFLQEPPLMKEEQELLTNQEEEQLQGLQSDTKDYIACLSVNHQCDQKDSSQPSHLDQTPTGETKEDDSLPTNTTEEQIKAEPFDQDYAALEPGRDPQPLSGGTPDCPTAQRLEEQDNGGVLLEMIKSKRRQGKKKKKIIKGSSLSHAGSRKASKLKSPSEALPGLKMPQGRHTGEKPYQCHVCNKTFNRKRYIVEHMRTHTGEKPYHCQECNKAFSHKLSVTYHMRLHTGEKPYQCQECGRSFSRKYSLDIHMRTHTGEKPYQCQECNRTFTHKLSLTSHLRLHTGEKPYQCQDCKKRFTQKVHMTEHRTRHH